jgi:RNA polymerase sigma factor for flagellar operon FliA
VKFIAGRVTSSRLSPVDTDDLVGYGVIGLIDAIDRFDPSRGVKFETYASVRIKGAIIDELRKLSWVPRSALKKITALNRAREELMDMLGREPNDEEVASSLEITVEDLRKIEGYINYLSVSSLEDVIFATDDDMCLSSVVEDTRSPKPEEVLEKKERYSALKDAIEVLGEKDKLLMSLYYYEKMTLKEIGEVMGISESRVCQLHSRAILRLRDNLKKLNY